jgi:hypothetical protein
MQHEVPLHPTLLTKWRQRVGKEQLLELLAEAIATVERTTGVSVTDAYVDKGYRGHDYKGDATIHISGTSARQLHRTQKTCRK